MTDVVIVGAGHNGLTAAFYLAKAGRRPLVLERRDVVGGGAITEEIHPGFRCPRLSHEILLESRVASEMNLAGRGLVLVAVQADACAVADEGAIVLSGDPDRSVESVRARSPHDATAFLDYCSAVNAVAGVLGGTFDALPPDVDAPDARDVWGLLKAGRRFRKLPPRDRHRLLRWLTMPVGDFLGEWFDDGLLKALLAGPGLSGTRLGPRSAGGTLVLLLREASRARAGGRRLRVQGGPGALTRTMAECAVAAGAEIRTGVSVDRIVVRDGLVTGIVAAGREIPCRTVVSGIDPRTTYLSLIDDADLDPEFRTQARNYRAFGTVAKINLALSGLPAFRHVPDVGALSGRIHIGRDLDYLERAFDHAKYGELSESPWLDITIPSIADTELAPPGAHVASIYAHYAPYALRAQDWHLARDVLLERTIAVLDAHAPGVRSQVVAAEVIDPARLEVEWGLAGGHMFHGELALDQLYTMRPWLGYARYRGPLRGLYLCGGGSHPGGFLTGTSGRLAARAILGSTARDDR